MNRLYFIFGLLLTMLCYSCDCDFFSGCPPSSDELINEYFHEASMTPGCKVEFFWAGGRDGHEVFGVIFCPSNIRDEIIQAAEPWNGCLVDMEYEDDSMLLGCNLFDFKNLFAGPNYNQYDPPEWYPSTYQGIWSIYNVEVEQPKDDQHFHGCTLYYHEKNGNLYFRVAKGRHP